MNTLGLLYVIVGILWYMIIRRYYTVCIQNVGRILVVEKIFKNL